MGLGNYFVAASYVGQHFVRRELDKLSDSLLAALADLHLSHVGLIQTKKPLSGPSSKRGFVPVIQARAGSRQCGLALLWQFGGISKQHQTFSRILPVGLSP